MRDFPSTDSCFKWAQNLCVLLSNPTRWRENFLKWQTHHASRMWVIKNDKFTFVRGQKCDGETHHYVVVRKPIKYGSSTFRPTRNSTVCRMRNHAVFAQAFHPNVVLMKSNFPFEWRSTFCICKDLMLNCLSAEDDSVI